MKKTLAFIGAAAAALTFAGAAHADNGGGYVGLTYTDSPDNPQAWTVDGAYQFGSNIQVDGGYTNVHSSDADLYSLGGHFFNRGDHWLLGGYLGYDRFNGGGNDVNEWTIAAQTQYYADKTILSGDLSYSRSDQTANQLNTYQLSGDARFFATDNLNFDLYGGYGHLDTDFGNGHFFMYGAGAEWKPDALPVSLFANVDAFDLEGPGNIRSWSLGVRYNFGGSLYDRYRNGAGLSSPHGFISELF